MSSFGRYERPYAIRDAGGLVVYESAAYVLSALDVVNSGAAAIGRGEAVYLDQAGSIFPRWDYSTAGTDTIPLTVIKGKRVDAAANVCFLGVALENIPIAASGSVAGPGSISAVKCLSGPTSDVVGNAVIGSATAGSVDMIATAPTKGTVLGEQMVVAGTGAGESGSATQTVVLIGPR